MEALPHALEINRGPGPLHVFLLLEVLVHACPTFLVMTAFVLPILMRTRLGPVVDRNDVARDFLEPDAPIHLHRACLVPHRCPLELIVSLVDSLSARQVWGRSHENLPALQPHRR